MTKSRRAAKLKNKAQGCDQCLPVMLTSPVSAFRLAILASRRIRSSYSVLLSSRTTWRSASRCARAASICAVDTKLRLLPDIVGGEGDAVTTM